MASVIGRPDAQVWNVFVKPVEARFEKGEAPAGEKAPKTGAKGKPAGKACREKLK